MAVVKLCEVTVVTLNGPQIHIYPKEVSVDDTFFFLPANVSPSLLAIFHGE